MRSIPRRNFNLLLGVYLIVTCQPIWASERILYGFSESACASFFSDKFSDLAHDLRIPKPINSAEAILKKLKNVSKNLEGAASFKELVQRTKPTLTRIVNSALHNLYRSDHEVTAALFSRDEKTISGIADITDSARYTTPLMKSVAIRDEAKLRTAQKKFKLEGMFLISIFHFHPVSDVSEISRLTISEEFSPYTYSNVQLGKNKRKFTINDPSGGDVESFIDDWNDGLKYFMMIGSPSRDGTLSFRFFLPLGLMESLPLRGWTDPSKRISVLNVLTPKPGTTAWTRP